MSYIASELRRMRQEVVRLNRRIALQRVPGKVVERDFEKRKVRLEIGEDPETGKKVLSPWVRIQSVSAGKLKIAAFPEMGEQLYLESPSGVVGADSLATWGAFDDENKRPDHEQDEIVIERDNARFTLKPDRIKGKVGNNEFEATDTFVRTKAGNAKTVVKSGFAKLVQGGGAVFVQNGQPMATSEIVIGSEPEPSI